MSYVMERVHTDPRLRRRRKAVERTRRRKLFVRSAVIVALIVLTWAVLWSPLLHVRDVELRGARHTSAEEVVAALDLENGTNILRFPTDVVRERVEALAWVKHASVTRVLPDTLRIKIEERRPAMVLALGAANWIVDDTGRVLEAGKNPKLPVLAGTDVNGIEIGSDLDAEQLVGGLRVYRSLPRGLQRQVVAIFAPTTERITLALADGSQVRYGSAELLGSKSEVLKSLLRRLQRDALAASYIDLRVPTSPAVSPVTVVPTTPVAPLEEVAPEAATPAAEDLEAEAAVVDGADVEAEEATAADTTSD